MKRRLFLKTVGAASGIALYTKNLFAKSSLSSGENKQAEMLPRRQLGQTDDYLSIVGFPGNSFRHYEQAECTEGIRRAVDRGVNFFDVAPAYGKDGECEIKMGVGLQGLRDQVFLACKTKKRDKAGAREELETSLKRLKTDHFDLYQMHFLSKMSEVEQVFGPGGAMETFVKAKEEGLIRNIGFSAHTTVAAMATMSEFKFDTVMYPINFVEHFNFGFGAAVLERAHNQGVSVIAIKPTSGGGWAEDVARADQKWWFQVINDQPLLDLALRFSLSQKNVVSAIPASFLDHVDNVITAAHNFNPITKPELKELLALARDQKSLFMEQQKRGLSSTMRHHHDDEFMMC